MTHPIHPLAGTVEEVRAFEAAAAPAAGAVFDALREAEAALEVSIARILKNSPGHSISATSEAKALVAVRAALAAAPAAPTAVAPHITQPYTLDEIRARIASGDYSAELLLQHAMLLLDKTAAPAAPAHPAEGVPAQAHHGHRPAWLVEDQSERAAYDEFRRVYSSTVAPKNFDMAWDAWQYRAALTAQGTGVPAPEPASWPIAPDVAADLERSDWAPEEALRWYAAGRHYDTVPNGDGTSSARILDNGAVASNALKSLSREYAQHKGDVALLEAAPAPVVLPEPVAWRHSRTYDLHEAEEEVQLADGDEHAEPLYTEQQVRALLSGVAAPAAEAQPVATILDMGSGERAASFSPGSLNSLEPGTKLYAGSAPAADALDAVTIPVSALRDLRKDHIYMGLCPEDSQPDSRDPDCPCCKATLIVDAAIAAQAAKGA